MNTMPVDLTAELSSAGLLDISQTPDDWPDNNRGGTMTTNRKRGCLGFDLVEPFQPVS
jgi:hypothetical protein